MPIINPDTSEAIDLTTIEAGTYHAKITEAPTQHSKGEGGKVKVLMVVPKFAITVNGKERSRKAYLPCEGDGSAGFDQLLRAVHMDELADVYKDPAQANPPFDTDVLINQELELVIDNEYFQKKDPAGNPIGQPELRDKIKSFLKA